MSAIVRDTVAIATDSGGDFTGYTTKVFTGYIHSIVYTDTDMADTTDVTITGDATGAAILTLTNVTATGTYFPRAGVHGPTGTALTYDGTRTVNERVAVVNERIKVVVAQGGDTKTGSVAVVVEGTG